MSKQLMLALGAGGAAVAAVVASAASIGTVNSTDLGAGQNVVLSCDSSVDVSYVTTFVNGVYRVSTVTLDGIDDTACADQDVEITLFGAGNTALATASGTIADVTESMGITGGAASYPLASAVTGVAVVISG